jgi:hypothetical protein
MAGLSFQSPHLLCKSVVHTCIYAKYTMVVEDAVHSSIPTLCKPWNHSHTRVNTPMFRRMAAHK